MPGSSTASVLSPETQRAARTCATGLTVSDLEQMLPTAAAVGAGYEQIDDQDDVDDDSFATELGEACPDAAELFDDADADSESDGMSRMFAIGQVGVQVSALGTFEDETFEPIPPDTDIVDRLSADLEDELVDATRS